MSVLLIYQRILVDKDDLVHGRLRQGASSGVHSQTSHGEDPLVAGMARTTLANFDNVG